MSRTRTAVAALAFGLAWAGSPLQHASAAAPPQYAVDLVGAWGQDAAGFALNNHGQVTGTLGLASGSSEHQAFVWDRQGGLLGLGTLGGIGSYGNGINDRGQVVGRYQLADGRSQAFIHDQGGMRALDTPGALNAWASGINVHGQVTGTVELAGGHLRPFVHDGNTLQVIDPPNCCDRGYRGGAINDHGDVVGTSERPGLSYPIVLHEGFVYRDAQVTDLGTLSAGAMSWANDINNHGQIVGTADDENGEYHGILWDPGTGMTVLPSFEDGVFVRGAAAINEHGDVVGNLFDETHWRDGAYLFSDGELVDLQGLLGPGAAAQWSLLDAYDINDRGQILVRAYDPATSTVGTLLLTPVPEPGTVALLTTGLALLGVRGRRCRERKAGP